MSQLLNEIFILHDITHQFIMNYVESFTDSSRIYIVSEPVDMSINLYDYIKNPCFSENDANKIIA